MERSGAKVPWTLLFFNIQRLPRGSSLRALCFMDRMWYDDTHWRSKVWEYTFICGIHLYFDTVYCKTCYYVLNNIIYYITLYYMLYYTSHYIIYCIIRYITKYYVTQYTDILTDWFYYTKYCSTSVIYFIIYCILFIIFTIILNINLY